MSTELQPGHEIKLRYREAPAFTLPARVIAVWERGTIEAPIMSASSGPKDYIKNEIFALFEAQPAVNRIAMMRKVGGVTFYLFRHESGTWHDNTGKQVVGE